MNWRAYHSRTGASDTPRSGSETRFCSHAFGQRGGRVRDPFGNIWWISAVVEDVAPEEGMRRLSEPAYADAMREAQETFDRELSGRDHVVASPPFVR